MELAARSFFTSTYFAVAGASQNTSKFGYKILAWYHAQSLNVTAINPSRPNITVKSSTYSAIASPSELPHPSETGVSIITPPKVTKEILKEAKSVGIKAVWLQPGSFDQEVLDYAVKEFEAGVGGEGGRGSEGWCVLVDGEAMLADARDASIKGKIMNSNI